MRFFSLARLLRASLALVCVASAACSAAPEAAEHESAEPAAAEAVPTVAEADLDPQAIGWHDRCCIIKGNIEPTVYCQTMRHVTKIRANNDCRAIESLISGANDSVVRGGTCEGSWAERCAGKMGNIPTWGG
jgi:hypothetical protein